ncbi:plasmid mobilization relaxosome protein MobC [Psychrobacter sp. B38]|uniref:plasmid mobilization protein n=1 Tax=Psychrobacter sp. B38 TaxID=3143538 RepID=UPI00320C6B6E
MNRADMEEPQKKIRQKSIKVRFNETEYERVLKRQSGNTLAGWLRQVALGIVPIHQADAELVRNIGRIGSNLNQLARYVNTQKIIDQNVHNEIVAIRTILQQLIAQNIVDAIAEDNSNDC